MTDLNSDTAPKSGKGSDADRLSQSPQSIRRGGADPTDVDPSPVTSETGDLGYDANPLKPSAPLSERGKEAT